MPTFTKMDPEAVAVGRGRAAQEARRPYVEALSAADAGMLELARGEKPSTVKRLLQDAARTVGVRVRSSWADPSQRTLYWKKIGLVQAKTTRTTKK